MDGLTWEVVDGELVPRYGGHPVAWAPQAGSQQAFLSCPVLEALLEGPRGTGKTDVLLMDFAREVGGGLGMDWQGLLFRQTYKQLADVVRKTKRLFPRIFPLATYNEAAMRWTWPGGEQLTLSYIERPEDYYNYHGQQFTWIGFEELTTWPTPDCFTMMLSCLRSSNPRAPKRYRATTNPYGPGHSWVKSRYNLPVAPGLVVGPMMKNPERVAIHSTFEENRVLLHADPDYKSRVLAAARNESERKAWGEGDWNVVAGGMFDDVWDPKVHVVPDLPASAIPDTWRLDRSYDHGQSHPFSVGWWAQSSGEPVEVSGRVLGSVRGDLFRVAEWYGWTGQPNAGVRLTAAEIAEGIRDREEELGLEGRVRRGPADSSIFDEWEPGKSVAGDMAARGVYWDRADKGPGSRRQGWQQVRQMLKAATAPYREEPGLFVCRSCAQFTRTVPVLPRDDRDLDDVDTDAEDHVADEVRYRCRHKPATGGCRDF